MGVKVAKDAIDLGIVTTNGPAMLAFYRDVLGFVHEGDIAMEHVGIKVHAPPVVREESDQAGRPGPGPEDATRAGRYLRRHRVPLLDDDHP